MKTYRLTHFVAAAISLAALSATGCTKQDRMAGASLSPAGSVAKPAATIALSESSTPVLVATTASSGAADAPWTDLESFTFERRVEFVAGLKRLEARVDEQIRELTATRAAMKNTAVMPEWDFAMKEMDNARSYLKSMGEETGKATAETWHQQKEKVGQAWKRTQAAYDKVRASTTG